MDTFFPHEADLGKKWYVADADQIVLGRLSAKIASILRGKHKATYTPTRIPATLSSSSTPRR